MNTDSNLQNHPFKFEPGIFEVQNQTDPQFGDAQVIQHLAAFVIGNPNFKVPPGTIAYFFRPGGTGNIFEPRKPAINGWAIFKNTEEPRPPHTNFFAICSSRISCRPP